jgi:uroporphyrinogen decarboxylase
MRQAGRYMPQYRAIRERYSFLDMCHTPALAAEVTLLPIEAFGMDAAILFSDILVIPEILGVGVHFPDKVGPVIEFPLNTIEDIEKLPYPDVREKLGYVDAIIRLLKPSLSVPLIGFCGAPFTLASYMIEGGMSRDLKKTKQWMLRSPASFHILLDRLAALCIDYLHLQIDAGVQAVQIFDTWASVLAMSQFREFSLHYLERITKEIKRRGTPVILFCRGSSVFAPMLAEASPAAIGVDWNIDISQLRPAVGYPIALQGNLDPDILYAPRHTIQKEALRIVESMRKDSGFIFNLGHGIHPDTPMDSVKALVEIVKSS